MSTDGTFVRFSRVQRLQHALILVLFTALALTGFPQKFHDAELSRSILGALGGVTVSRQIHRVAGALFALLLVWHVGVVLAGVVRRRIQVNVMVPRRQDFLDAIHMLKYDLGYAKEPPRFDRFDYRQKFEYWGLVFGSFLMVATGVVLLYPMQTAALLVGDLIPIAKVAHSNEGLMAFLVVIVWHIYNAHLSPDVFPFDRSIFTGKISRARMHHEHPLELVRLEKRG